MTMKTKKTLAAVVAVLLALLVFAAPVAAGTDVYEVGSGKTYSTLEAAVAVATDSNDDKEITYHIYGKIEISSRGWNNPRGNSGATTINFVGMTPDAEISLIHGSLDSWSQIMGTDNVQMVAINYDNLTLSKPNGIWVGDIAHHNRMFTTYMRGAPTDATVTYTNCTFPNGSGNNQYGKTVYDTCKLYSEDYYALWIYDAGDTLRADTKPASVEVKNCQLIADRGIKVYSECQDGTAKAKTTISNCYFKIETTPAVVSSLDGTITMTDVNYDACPYGLLERGYLNGNPIYTLAIITVDGAEPTYAAHVTYTNEWGGTESIYVTDTDYAEHIVAENAEYGSTLIELPVAKVGDKKYFSLEEAVTEAAENGATVTLLKDVELSSEVNLTIDKSLTLDGKGLKISGDTSHGVIDLFGGSDEGITVTIKNITVTNDKNYAVRVATKANLNIDGSILDGFGAVYVTQNGITNADAQGDASTVIITNSKLSSTGTNEAFGTVAIFANSTKISISGSTLDVTMPKENTGTQAIVRFGSNTKDAVHTGSSVSIVDSTLNVIKEDGSTGTAAIFSKGNKETGTLAFTLGEGVYSNVNPSAYIAEGMEVVQPGNLYKVQVYVDRSSSSSSSVKPEEPEQPEEPVVEPETPTEEPVAGEPTVETEVTDGGEVTFETPAEPENPDAGEPGDAPADAPAEPAVTGVVLPEGTDSEVAFIPVSEKPAPAGKEENTKKVFEINVPKYEKGKPATVKFTMTVAELEKDGKTAADVALWHHDEETGEWTKLVTTFVIKDGIVYFEAITFDFSPFAIVYEDTELPTDEPETPEQPTESPAPILAVLAGLGAAVVLRRK
ncbi:PGF-pre-PGF domain-containing protein [Methanocorpusculum sp.]|nr:PGF-pre-PGF domain-containing protein [Methanocorpusculum sp.]